jgi:hypothetical protein
MASEAPTTEATATEAPKTDGRIKTLANVPATLNHPVDTSAENLKKLASGKNTKAQPRAEFIREMWATKSYTRSQIRDMVAAFGDDPEVKYQIVFQATKGVEGGPAPQAAAPATAEAAPAE